MRDGVNGYFMQRCNEEGIRIKKSASGKKREKEKKIERERGKEKEKERQTDRQTDRQINRTKRNDRLPTNVNI